MERIALYSWFAVWLVIAVRIGYWVRRQRRTVASLAPTHPTQMRTTLIAVGALQCTFLLALLSVLPILQAFPRFNYLLQDDAVRLGYWLGVGMSQLICLIAEVALYVRFRSARPA